MTTDRPLSPIQWQILRSIYNGDFCDTCAVPWEECGHRRPETRDRHYAQPEQSKETQP